MIAQCCNSGVGVTIYFMRHLAGTFQDNKFCTDWASVRFTSSLFQQSDHIIIWIHTILNSCLEQAEHNRTAGGPWMC